MRCEDCVPLIEEYFDGEVDERTSERMGAHLSACADCASALDALSFEQEVYARYQRDVEVSPALWAAVRSEIAREPSPETRDNGQTFLSRLREVALAPFALFALRPAYSSTLALLFIGVTASALWFSLKPRQTVSTPVAVNARVNPPIEIPSTVAPRKGADVKAADVPVDDVASVESFVRQTPRSQPNKRGPELSPEEMAKLLDYQPPRPRNENLVDNDEVHHSKIDPLIVEENRTDAGVVVMNAQMLDAGEKEVARHVEQTQMLLRSIKNAHSSDDGRTVDVAYEKKLSRKLLADNATLQLEAEVKGDKDTKQVLDQIEPFLLDIANMRDNPSREEVRSLKERVKKDDIIAALQVY